MKKTITLACFSLIFISGHAQFKVGDNGLIGIGSSIESENAITLKYDVPCGIEISNNSKLQSRVTGILVNGYKVENIQFTGVCIVPGRGTSKRDFYGVRSLAGLTTGKCYGVYGGLYNYGGHYTSQGAGIYGTSTLDNDGIAYPGCYAGYFHGDVRVTGTLYGTLSTPSANSDAVSIRAVALNTSDSQDLRFIDRLQGVSLLQFDNPVADKISMIRKDGIFPDANSDELVTQEMLDEYVASGTPQKTVVSYGLAADQLKEVFPDLVHEDSDGNVSVNYIELIPMLVQALNELNAELVELKGENAYSAKLRSMPTNIDSPDVEQVISLSQNIPNPFGEKTTIDMNIPEIVKTASLFIYDMNGKQVKRIDIAERGSCKICVTSEGLEAGMYLYSLITDGRVANTKRMILTK